MNETVHNRLQEVEESTQGPGRLLREARRAQQLDQTEVAGCLNLDRKLVDAIERDDFSVMPPSTFIRGYLRSYARLVGLAPDKVVNEYDCIINTDDASDLRTQYSTRRQADFSDSYMRWMAVGVVLLLILGVGFWFVDQQKDVFGIDLAIPRSSADPNNADSSPAQTAFVEADTHQDDFSMLPVEGESPKVLRQKVTLTPEQPLLSEPPVLQDSEPEALIEATDTSEIVEKSVETNTLEHTEVVVDAPNLSTVIEPGPVTSEEVVEQQSEGAHVEYDGVVDFDPEAPLILYFAENCWTSVQVAEERLVYRVINAGEVVSINANGPYRITLGNAGAVRVVYNGEPYDFKHYIRGNIARFTLDN